MNVTSSEFSMNLNFSSALGLTGVSTAKEINIENSKVNLDVSGDHSVYGVLANGEFTPPDKYTGVKIMIANSDFVLDLHNSKKIPNGDTFGVICGDLDVGIGNQNQQVRISVNDGKALLLVTSDFTDKEVQPQPGYQANHLHLLNDTYCVAPEKNQVNQTSVYVGDPKMTHHYQTAETIYNANDMSLAMEIVFKKGYVPLSKRVSWNRDKDSNLKVTVIGRGNEEAALNKFVELNIDNNTVDRKYYEVKKGSVIITISKDYLQSLSDGVHIAKAIFSDGEAQFKIIISRNPAPSPDPDKPRYIPPLTGIE